MVKQAKTTKKVTTRTSATSKAAKQPIKKSTAKRQVKSTKVAYYPNLMTFLVSTAAVLILFSLAFIVSM